jgi:YidC/Oxa1 family membrane protein insertase
VLADGATELRVPLTWTDGQGLTVTKTFVFTRGLYSVDLIYDVQNAGAAPRKLASYAQFLRHWEHASRSYFDVETYSFKGPAVWDGTKSHDLNVENDSDSKFSQTITNGWLASLQHQFVSAIVPTAGQPYDYKLQVRDNKYLLSATGPMVEVAAGGKAQFHEKLFVGPKLQSQLAATAPHLERTVDFGILTVLAQPLFAGLNWIHGLIGNWGWSIIIVTAIIKLIFYPLSQASGRSMAKMRTVAPRMKQIQETFKDDREKLGRAMMELYKKEKINPLAGCLPMLVQIPFFISFYRVLLESVEMRQAPFLLWVNDLSSRDPFFVLPLLMGGAMYRAVQVESRAARSHAGEDHAVHAAGDDGNDGLVSGGLGALLVHQYLADHCAAVAGQPSGRSRGRQAANVKLAVNSPDTIVAIASAPGRGAVGVIRVSGPRCRKSRPRFSAACPPRVARSRKLS